MGEDGGLDWEAEHQFRKASGNKLKLDALFLNSL